MRGEGFAIFVEHLIGVAVVCRDHHNAAHLVDSRLHQIAHAGVHCLDCRLCRVEDAGVSHHVAVGEVDDDDVVLARKHAVH